MPTSQGLVCAIGAAWNVGAGVCGMGAGCIGNGLAGGFAGGSGVYDDALGEGADGGLNTGVAAAAAPSCGFPIASGLEI